MARKQKGELSGAYMAVDFGGDDDGPIRVRVQTSWDDEPLLVQSLDKAFEHGCTDGNIWGDNRQFMALLAKWMDRTLKSEIDNLEYHEMAFSIPRSDYPEAKRPEIQARLAAATDSARELRTAMKKAMKHMRATKDDC